MLTVLGRALSQNMSGVEGSVPFIGSNGLLPVSFRCIFDHPDSSHFHIHHSLTLSHLPARAQVQHGDSQQGSQPLTEPTQDLPRSHGWNHVGPVDPLLEH